MFVKLNLPDFELKCRGENDQQQVFDPIRKKYVSLTPEEYVRQYVINYLTNHKGFPVGLLSVEVPVSVNNMQQRADIVAFSRSAKPLLVVECKAFSIELTQQTYAQAARYNLSLKAPYLMVTNGIAHYISKIDFIEGKAESLQQIPNFSEIG